MSLFLDTILGKKRNLFFICLLFILSFFGFQSLNLKLDASSDTLILENDKDLIATREVSDTYSSNEFLIITLSDADGIVTTKNIKFITTLDQKINQFDWVVSTQSILDAPLLTINNQSLSDLANEIKTLKDTGINIIDAEEELKKSPIFRELVISEDGSTSAILINLRENERLNELIKLRSEKLSNNKRKIINQEYENIKKTNDKKRSQNIFEIRNLIKELSNQGIEMHLGGIPMIADDTITFVKNDMIVFGFGVLIFILLVLYLIFRSPIWIAIALSNCIVSLILMVGVVSSLNWKITVISSNFISLMLILSLSMTVHIIVRYRQIINDNENLGRIDLIKNCCLKMVYPCLFTALTTIFAFGTLYSSGIKPVMDFGLMMCLGLTITLVTSFIYLPIILSFFSLKNDVNLTSNNSNNILLRLAKNYQFLVIISFLFMLIVGIYGVQLLKVENSFVDYFKKDTEIYKGMKKIDQELGGTTPLDIIIQFNSDDDNNIDEIDEDFLDFEIDYNPEDYWFTKEKINIVKDIHDHLDSYPFSGKILSLASLVRTAEQLNDNKEFDALELGILYKKLPSDLKNQILSPYLSIEKNQARISMRIIDTHKELRRNEFVENLTTYINENFSSDAYQVSISGILILYNNMLQSLFDSQIKSLLIVMVGIFFMLSILFRSLQIALVTIVPNIIACFTILGTMGLLNIPLDLMTITIASITIGIAVDNCIHYVYRYKEYYNQTNNHLETIALCQNTVGRAIQNTSSTIIAGFSILIFSNFYPTIYFGIFTAMAMFIALLGSLTLLPSLLKYIKV
ncbi:MAG: MMPL family transporter [Pelagibacterales bacterium]|nr:MMPL family transporter [Pelagibacterales bacterium]